jgi:hypothetical protein
MVRQWILFVVAVPLPEGRWQALVALLRGSGGHLGVEVMAGHRYSVDEAVPRPAGKGVTGFGMRWRG